MCYHGFLLNGFMVNFYPSSVFNFFSQAFYSFYKGIIALLGSKTSAVAQRSLSSEVKPISNATLKTRQVTQVSSRLPNARIAQQTLQGGMHNAQNSCYMASSLQAVFRLEHMLQWLLSKENDQNPFVVFLRSALKKPLGIEGREVKTLSSEKTQEIREFFYEQGWSEAGGEKSEADSVVFLDYLLKKLEVPGFVVTQKAKVPGSKPPVHFLELSIHESEALEGHLLRKNYRLDSKHIPDIFPIVIKRRLEADIQCIITPEIHMPLTNQKTAVYSLQTAIIYTGRGVMDAHYYAIVQKADGSWICYNDGSVSLMTNTQARHLLASSCYICFYARNS